VDQVRQGFDVLMDAHRLGAVLLQFPWSFKRTEENFEWFGDVVRTFNPYPLVAEVRHVVQAPEFLRLLVVGGVGLWSIDQPPFPNSIKYPPTLSASVTSRYGRNYKEWFREKAGVEQRYNYLCKPDELEPWVERAREIAGSASTREVYVITNNHYKGKAVANALMMRSMLSGERVPAPSGVFEAYSDVVDNYTAPVEEAVEAGTN
jgi:uncharacterized protein YecE (DUF72 family)